MAAQDLMNIFEDCVERLAAGQSLQDCLRQYPDDAARLRPLLETSEQMRALRIAQAELAEDREIVWQKIEQNLPRGGDRDRRSPPLLFILLLIVMPLSLLALVWTTQRPPDQTPGEADSGVIPVAASSTPAEMVSWTPSVTSSLTLTETLTATSTDTVTASPTSTLTKTPTSTPTDTATASPSPTHTATVTASPTLTRTHTATVTSSPTLTRTPTATHTPSATMTPSLTFVPGCGAPLTEDDAIRRVLEIYPNTTITRIVQTVKYGDILVWEVQTSHRLEVNIDVGCGTILTIEQAGSSVDEASPDDNAAGNDNFQDSSSGANQNADNDNDDDEHNGNDD